MFTIFSISPYTGRDTRQHQDARKMMGVEQEATYCKQGVDSKGNKVTFIMRGKFSRERTTAEIVYWIGDNSPARSSLFLVKGGSGKIFT